MLLFFVFLFFSCWEKGWSESYYLVEPGDTFAAIAKKVGLEKNVLMELNRMRQLKPGQMLTLPQPRELTRYVAVVQPGAKISSFDRSQFFPVMPYLQLDAFRQEGSFYHLTHYSGAHFLAPLQDVVLIYSAESYGRYLTTPFFEYLLQFYGIPYQYGGNDPERGIDCSFYVQAAFSAAGYSLPRVSAQQFQAGYPVRSDKMVGGDLVFFAKTMAGVSHVGIYWGATQFIHASVKGVRFSSLREKYYLEHFVGARRIL